MPLPKVRILKTRFKDGVSTIHKFGSSVPADRSMTAYPGGTLGSFVSGNGEQANQISLANPSGSQSAIADNVLQIDDHQHPSGADSDHNVPETSEGAPVTASTSCASDAVLDLSTQQRNLLLMRPLFDLEQGKRNVTDSAGEAGLLSDIDTHYLALSLLDFLMEGVAIGSGQYPEEVVKHLMALVGVMAPQIDEPNKRKAAEHVLAHIANAKENYKEFAFDYFDANRKRTQTHRFKLVSFEPDLEENYLFKPTEEGYLVYLGMLDLAPEDASELMEKMLQLLIKRNRFAQAIDIAKRARTLSIEFRQIIRDTITRARRTPRAVDWQNDIQWRLDKARGHVTERRKEDGTMMISVRTSLAGTDEFEVRQNIIKLMEILQSAGNIRSKLHTEIMQAPDQYLQAHSLVFRVRGPSNLPSLEEMLFPQAMGMSVDCLAEHGDSIVSSSYPCKFPHLFEFNSVFALLLDKRAKPVPVEEEEGRIVAGDILTEMFSKEEIAEAETWINEKLENLEQTTVERLIEMAEAEVVQRSIVLCIALYLYIAINESSQIKNIDITINEHTFRTQNVRGTSLTFMRRGKPPTIPYSYPQ